MKIETFTTKKNVGQENSTLSSKRDPLGLFMSRRCKLYLLAFALIMVCAINSVKAQKDTIQIDFGTTASPANWNFLNSNTINSNNPALINSKGVATTVGMKLTGIFTNFNAAGTNAPAPSTGFPGTVTVDNIYAGPTASPKYDISGLDPTKEYTFIIFSSRLPADATNREGKFQFTGSTEGICTLNATGNTSNIATATAKPTAEGVIIFKISSVSGGNIHLNAMKIVYANQVACATSFSEGAVTVCQDAANETYTATTTNSAPVVYSVLPAEAGVIDPATGVMNWDAAFFGTATIRATADESCGSTTADRVVMVNPSTGAVSFTAGAESVLQDAADETYTATAANSTSIVYSALPAEAGVINPSTGVMNWDAAFFGTATITATADGLCGTTTADKVVTVSLAPVEAQNDSILIDFGGATGPSNWVKYSSHLVGANIINMINSKEVATSIGMKLTVGWGGAKTEASNPTDPSNGFPLAVTNDYFYVGAGGKPEFEISGLDPNKDYSFILFCSRPGADGAVREGKFEFIGSTEGSCTLNATANTFNTATATSRPTAEGKIIFKISQTNTGNVHLNAMKIIYDNSVACATSFTDGAVTVCQDAANETYTATTTNSAPVVYSVLPAEAGVIDPATGVMNWDAAFFGTATIRATADESCGSTTADRIVTVNPSTGAVSFTAGAESVLQDAADETYTATAANSTSIVYSALPAEAGVINPATGVMNWDASFFGTATIKATAEGLCGTTTANRVVMVTVKSDEAQNDTIQIDFGSVASPANWNFYNAITAGTNKTNLINSKGVATPVGMMITTGFGGINTSATSTPDPSTGFPGTVTADNFYVGAGGIPVFEISGLDPTKEYTFIIFASRMPADATIREGKYQFTGSTEGICTLNATGNTSNIATATAKPTAEGKIIFKISQTGAGNVHLNAMKIVQVNQVVCATSFSEGAVTVCQDAANETYTATTTNSAPVVYSVLPAEAGVIDPATGVMNWDAAFFGTATIRATADESCGFTTADRVVMVKPATGATTFTVGAVTVCQDAADETYTATAANSTSIVYSALPAEAGVINPGTGVMNWNAAFFGTATIKATAEGLCGITTADRVVTVNPATGATTFTVGAVTVHQNAADETYTATASNSTSIVYSAFPAEAGVINPATGVMNWDASFFGTATITATAEGLCGTTTANRVVTVNKTTGTKLDRKNNVNLIFPNPAKDNINVQVLEPSNVKIMDITGKVLIEKSVEPGDNQIILNIKSGIYMVRVSGQNKSVYTTKLVIQ